MTTLRLTLALTLGLTLVTLAPAQQGPAPSSTLLRLPVTPGAIRVTDAAATREFGSYLSGLAREEGSTCQASEYLVWNDPELADRIVDDLGTQFGKRGLVFETLDEVEEDGTTALSFRLTEKANRYVGLLYLDDESVVLGWCQLRAAQAQAAPAARPASPTPAAAAGVTPRPGTYTGDLTGDFKGTSISFQVAADGRTITNVRMTGYWRCRDSLSSSGAKLNARLIGELGEMPGNVPVQAGAFNRRATAPYLAWEFAGRFVSATQAQGTFLVEADDCTSYKLSFTATRR
ncbi:hypothetical protein L1280_002155 [Deinococcus sp. HSC-46F16]|uniref:hypothetical protein n=1 Tax=Deinococcus sp. HSC-46F16 TaxID=2910968 RepID=UPI00209CE715|nr:hypothetical protein [Deinococcus sp. HSC-46F16]MCP2015003.1 hypothetical protein [Deinococcus sp. HSC-46F16]